jgi:hypothetical protein
MGRNGNKYPALRRNLGPFGLSRTPPPPVCSARLTWTLLVRVHVSSPPTRTGEPFNVVIYSRQTGSSPPQILGHSEILVFVASLAHALLRAYHWACPSPPWTGKEPSCSGDGSRLAIINRGRPLPLGCRNPRPFRQCRQHLQLLATRRFEFDGSFLPEEMPRPLEMQATCFPATPETGQHNPYGEARIQCIIHHLCSVAK